MAEIDRSEAVDEVTSSKTKVVLSASDIERYGYCPLNWWLKFKGNKVEGKNLEEGTEKHEKIAKDFVTITSKEDTATRSQISIMWFAIIATLLGINGVAIVYFKYISHLQPETFSFVLLIIAILWIAIAVILFIFTLYKDIMISKSALLTVSESTTAQKVAKEEPVKTDVLSSELSVPGITQFNWKNLAGWFIVIAIALALTGYMLEYPFAPPEILSRILLAGALIWLIGTSIALYFVLTHEERMKKMEENDEDDEYLKISKRYSRSQQLMIWFSAGAAILGIAGFVVHYQLALETLDIFGKIFLILSLVWMSAAFLFFYQSLWGGVKTQRISQEILSILSTTSKEPVSVKEHIDAIEKGKVMGEEIGVLSMAVLATVLGINSILIRIEASDIFSRILEIVALIWLIGASFFLYNVLKHLQIAGKLRLHYKIGKASIEYTDTMEEEVKLLISENYGIHGRPDLILKKEGKIIPVEVKTGRIPKGPHFSHILQLAAYCLLVEDTYGVQPKFGLIRYGKEKEFTIEYDKKLKKLLLDKIAEMRSSINSKEAHRNHHRPNKCKYCSRRGECPEKLT